MLTKPWPLPPEQVSRYTNTWTDPEASGLLLWAIWAADGLFYLIELDEDTFGANVQRPAGQRQEAVDVAHVRWATSTAITVLDLCAATLGRLYCSPRGSDMEYALEDFRGRAGRPHFAQLSPPAQEWVRVTVGDRDYRIVKRARNPLVHRRVRRTVYLSVGAPPEAHGSRTGFYVGPKGATVDSRPLIEMCGRLVERRLRAFLTGVADGSLR